MSSSRRLFSEGGTPLKVSYHSRSIVHSDYLCYLGDSPSGSPGSYSFHLTTDSNTFLTMPHESYRHLRDVRVSGTRIKSDYYQCQIVLPDRSFEIGGLIIAKKELQNGNDVTLSFRKPLATKIQILRLDPSQIEFHELELGAVIVSTSEKRPIKTFQRLRPERDEIWSSGSD